MISVQREQFSLHFEREPFLGIAGEREGETSLQNNYKYNYKHIDKYNYSGIIEV